MSYNNISTIVKSVNPDFYKWVKKDIPKVMRADKSGTTFLIPDKDLSREILSSDDPITIVSMIRALKLNGCIQSLSGFMSPVVNNLGQYLPDTTRATKNGVTLNNGSVITEIDMRSENTSIKCYLLTKECIPIDGNCVDDDDEDDVSNDTPKPPPQQHTFVDRRAFAKRVEKEFFNDFNKNRDEYLVNISSFMAYLKNNNPDKYTTILPILGVDPCANFYIVFEPYCQSAFKIVDSALFNSWYDVRGLYMTNCVKFYTNMFDDLDNSTILGSKRSSLIKKLCTLKLDDANGYSVSTVVGIIKSAYNQLGKGILHKIKNVYSASTSKILAIPDLKLAHDEFRAIISPRLYKITQNKDSVGFKRQVKLIEIMYSFNNPTKQLMIVSSDQINNSIDPYMFVENNINPFLRSSFYCNIPSKFGEQGGQTGSIESNTPDELYEADNIMWKYINSLKYRDNTNHLSYLAPESKKEKQAMMESPMDDNITPDDVYDSI